MNQVSAVSTAVTRMMKVAVGLMSALPIMKALPCRTGGHRHVLKAGPKALDMDVEEGQAEFKPDRLLEQDGDAPGRQQRIQQPAVEAADDEALDDQTERGRDDEGERDGQQHVEVRARCPASTAV